MTTLKKIKTILSLLIFTAVIVSNVFPVIPVLKAQEAQAQGLSEGNYLGCDVSQTVAYGEDANYSLWLSGDTLEDMDVHLDLHTVQDEGTLDMQFVNDPVPLNSKNEYANIGTISTVTLSAGVTYDLTMVAVGSKGSTDLTCDSQLIVASTPDFNADIKCFTNGDADYQDGPCMVKSNTTALLAWTSEGTVSCQGSLLQPTINDLEFPTSINEAGIDTIPITGETIYKVECMSDPNAEGGPKYAADTVTLWPIEEEATLDIQCADDSNSGLFQDGPCEVKSNTPAKVSWATTGMDYCYVYSNIPNKNPDFFSTEKNGASESTGELFETHVYTIECFKIKGPTDPTVDHPNGWVPPYCKYAGEIEVAEDESLECYNDSVQVVVPGPGGVSADIRCVGTNDIEYQDGPCETAYGSPAAISWTSTEATTCTVNSNIPVEKPDYQSDGELQNTGVKVGNLIESHTYTINCEQTDPNGETPQGLGESVSLFATDSVTINVLDDGGGFDLVCSPFTTQISPGDTTSYDISTTNYGSFTDAPRLTASVASPSGGDARFYPTVTLIPTDKIPPTIGLHLEDSALVETTTSTSQVPYIITFTAATETLTKTCDVVLNVESMIAPSSPLDVTTDNSVCGQISVTWSPAKDGDNPAYYRVYRRGSSKGLSVQIKTQAYTGASSYTVIDNNPYAESNYYEVVAVNASSTLESTKAEPAITPVVSNSCEGDLSLSDQDILSVAGKLSKTFNPSACSASSEVATLPNNALFSPADSITYQINICNNGPKPFTGVSLVNTFSNLKNVDNVSSPNADCVKDYKYDSDTDTLNVNLQDISEASKKAVNSCDIIFTASISTPAGGNISLYRFQSVGRVYSAEITSDPSKYPLGYYQVYTPPYLFNVGGSIPSRGETSPQ